MEEEHVEPDLSNLSDEELEFYYFQVHDTDRNSKLDGLEILQAILHTSNHVNNEDLTESNDIIDNNDDFDYYVGKIFFFLINCRNCSSVFSLCALLLFCIILLLVMTLTFCSLYFRID